MPESTELEAIREDDDATEADRQYVEREQSAVREFVKVLSPDEIKSGAWFARLLTQGLTSYAEKVDSGYFKEKYDGVPADGIVDQRIKMAARYAAIEGGLSAGAYTATVAATIGSLGGASPLTVPAAVTTLMVDVVYTTQRQLRLAYDIAVLYRVPLDVSDPEDLWKLIRVAFTIKSGELAREGVLKAVPALVRPLVKKFFSGSVLTAAKGLPVVGKHLLQRNVIKAAIPGVGVPLAVMVNRFTTQMAGQHARSVFRNEARIIELAERLSEASRNPRLTLWVTWLTIHADGKRSDDETLLMRHLARVIRAHHDVTDEKLSSVIDIDEGEFWLLLEAEQGDCLDLVATAERVADVDGDVNKHERRFINDLVARCGRTGTTPPTD